MDAGRLSAETTLEYKVDPVCLSKVEATEAREHDLLLSFEERQYVFCSKECQDRFAREARRYAISGRSAP